MNYSTMFKKLTKEVSGVCQYKHLASPFKAFAIVTTIPFWFFYALSICLNYICLFFFNCLASSCDYLESWVRETKKDVFHATEAVIYFVSMPFIFFLRCLLSIFGIVFYLNWFCTMCIAYIATLGGIRWTPSISSAANTDSLSVTPKTNKTAGNTIILIGFILFCLWALMYLISLAINPYDRYVMSLVAGICDLIYTWFMLIAIPITFKHKVISVAEELDENNMQEQCTDIFEEEFPEF